MLEIIHIIFSLNYKYYFCLNILLIHISYIFFYNKVLLQLEILLFLRNNFFKKYYIVVKNIFPFKTLIQFFFFFFSLGMFYSLYSYSQYLIFFYIYLNLKIFLYVVVIPLQSYNILFVNSNLFYEYIKIIIQTNKNNLKVNLKILELLKTFYD